MARRSIGPVGVLLLVIVACTAGCRRKKASVRVQPITGESAVLPRIVRPTPPESVRVSPHAVDVAGRKRTYLLVEPAPLEPSRQYPLVFVLHGDGGDAAGFHRAWPFERATGSEAILVYLDGLLARWDLETTVDNPDVACVEAVVADVAKIRPLDRSRIYATGYSSGGFLANVVACQKPGLLRAIASNAGGAPYNQREQWPNGAPKCPGQQPTATLALHGARDFTVTLDSGRYTAEYWAYVNGCRETEMETTGYAECQLYRGCPSGKAVGFCVVDTLGHWVWDEAANASWTFFQRQ
jgi:polyhydroxybutyrate depolymerase